MYVVFLVLWIILNGQFTWEIFFFGAVIAAALYAFCCKYMGYSWKKDKRMLKKLPLVLWYVVILLQEIIKANIDTIRMVLSFREEIDPVIVKFETGLRSQAARVMLANSITLTPGTITVALEGDTLIVHALDADFAKGIEHNRFLRILRRIEAEDERKD